MTWRWTVSDLDSRVTFARMQSPTDFLTVLARFVVSGVTAALALVLLPVDMLARMIGQVLLMLVVGFIVLMLLDLIWLLVWGMLVGSSWLWINHWWLRPLLFLPGMSVAILAHIYIMVAPDPQKNPRYTMLPREWPLSWNVWRPPKDYLEAKSQA